MLTGGTQKCSLHSYRLEVEDCLQGNCEGVEEIIGKLGTYQATSLLFPHLLASVGSCWDLLGSVESDGIYWNLLESDGISWNLLESNPLSIQL